MSRLSAAGWEHELAFPRARDELRDHKLVNRPKDLTEKSMPLPLASLPTLTLLFFSNMAQHTGDTLSIHELPKGRPFETRAYRHERAAVRRPT